MALVAGIVSVLAALAFPFAPVTRPVVTYSWPASASPAPAAIPMLPYQPETSPSRSGGDAARGVPPGTVLLSTACRVPDPLAEPLQGLVVRRRGGRGDGDLRRARVRARGTARRSGR